MCICIYMYMYRREGVRGRVVEEGWGVSVLEPKNRTQINGQTP